LPKIRREINPEMGRRGRRHSYTGLRPGPEVEEAKKGKRCPPRQMSSPDEPKLLVEVAMGFLGAPPTAGRLFSPRGSTARDSFKKDLFIIRNIELPRRPMNQSRVRECASHGGGPDRRGISSFFKHEKEGRSCRESTSGNNEFCPRRLAEKQGLCVWDNLDTPYYKQALHPGRTAQGKALTACSPPEASFRFTSKRSPVQSGACF